MAGDKKKPSLSAFVASQGKDDDEDEAAPESAVTGKDDDFDVAAEDLFDAIKSGDLDAFKDALRAVKSC